MNPRRIPIKINPGILFKLFIEFDNNPIFRKNLVDAFKIKMLSWTTSKGFKA